MTDNKRFFVRFNDENYNKFWELVDRETGEVVGQDGGEPEDASLVRDFAWVEDLANQLHAERLGQWQPIETAPTDGSRVLVITAGVDLAADIARYDSDKYAKKPRPFWSRIAPYPNTVECRERPPTHWMPLPTPPASPDRFSVE